MKSNHLNFSSKVWLFSAIATPAIAGLLMGIFDYFSLEPLGAALMFVAPVGLILSIPNYLILIFCAWRINISNFSHLEKKIILNIISIILTHALFKMIFFYLGEQGGQEAVWLTAGYSISLSIAIWYFQLKMEPENNSKSPLEKVKYLEDIIDDEIY